MALALMSNITVIFPRLKIRNSSQFSCGFWRKGLLLTRLAKSSIMS